MLKPLGLSLAGAGIFVSLLAAWVWLSAPAKETYPRQTALTPGHRPAVSPAESSRLNRPPSATGSQPLPWRADASEADILTAARDWGETDLEAAVAWALGQKPADRQRCLEAVLLGGAGHPDLVLAVGRKLLDDPQQGEAYGALVAGTLTVAGQFETAVQFANESASPSRGNWLDAALARWAQNDPQSATQALADIPDENLRHSAFKAMVKGWADEKAPALAEYALTLPGMDRTVALDAAFDKWSLQDPAGLSAWLGEFERSPELDPAISLLVTRTDGANRSREVALAWAQVISDPELRFRSLAPVVKEWAATDRPAARNYVTSLPGLSPAQRAELLKGLNAPH